ncbi:MAG: signal peptidase I [Actinobacteria bacterium]|nr:signal peptidase I [Actinomycetota bacterium]
MTAPGNNPGYSRARQVAVALSLWVLLALFILVVIVLNVTHQVLRVDGPSMYPTIEIDDVALITRDYREPGRGDIILLTRKHDDNSVALPSLIKRVIALPGDEVEVKSGLAFVNGRPEPDTYPKVLSPGDISYPLTSLGENEVFVLGDNRPVSLDSRVFGPVSLERVAGEVVAIVAPLNRITIMN